MDVYIVYTYDEDKRACVMQVGFFTEEEAVEEVKQLRKLGLWVFYRCEDLLEVEV